MGKQAPQGLLQLLVTVIQEQEEAVVMVEALQVVMKVAQEVDSLPMVPMEARIVYWLMAGKAI